MVRVSVERAIQGAIIAPPKKFDVIVAVEDTITFALNKDCLLHAAVKKLKSSWIGGKYGQSRLHKRLMRYSVNAVTSDRNFEIRLTEADPFVAGLTRRVKRDNQKEQN
jgi:hypothetical protein